MPAALPGPVLVLMAALAAAAPARAAIDRVVAAPAGAVVVDARPAEQCAAASLPGARCLAAADLLGPHRRLASFRDILWALATAGLTGAEHVAVAGDGPADRDFLAGVLHLAGQRRVSILATPPARAAALAPGAPRAAARAVVYTAPMRAELIVLGHEIDAAAWLLDGRGEAEYWGARVRAGRGGHLPGAEHLPAASLRPGQSPALAGGGGAAPVAYGHDAVEGIGYFALLQAAGVPARVYPGGWAEWAADPTRQVDAASYPEPPAPPPPAAAPAAVWPLAAAGMAGALLGAVAMWRWRS